MIPVARPVVAAALTVVSVARTVVAVARAIVAGMRRAASLAVLTIRPTAHKARLSMGWTLIDRSFEARRFK